MVFSIQDKVMEINMIQQLVEECRIDTSLERIVQTSINKNNYRKKVTKYPLKHVRSRAKKLREAQQNKFNEFYTRYEDIEKEVERYPADIWKDKVVFCNCDDVVGDRYIGDRFWEIGNKRKESAFATYFIDNFERLQLKKLICLHYGGGSLINNGYIYSKTKTHEFIKIPHGFTGSFDDPFALQILNEEADIVCTNPPFSEAKKLWKIIIRSGKKFLIIANIITSTNQYCIPYFRDKKMWAGYNMVGKYVNQDGKEVSAPGYWFTNITIQDRPQKLKIVPLEAIPAECKVYDDHGVLIVEGCYVPSDYNKVFAVSVGPMINGILENNYKIVCDLPYRPFVNNKSGFANVLIQRISS